MMETQRFLVANNKIEVVLTIDDSYGCFGYYHNTETGSINQVVGKGLTVEDVLESIKDIYKDK